MNGEKKTTRKQFLRWSGLAFVGGLALSGMSAVTQKRAFSETKRAPSGTTSAVSRIRPAKQAVIRNSV